MTAVQPMLQMRPLILASSSPRRQEMLAVLKRPVHVLPPDIDDALLTSGRVTPRRWVTSLAYLKAKRVAELCAALPASGADSQPGDGETVNIDRDAIILAADTLCVLDGRVLGQPTDRADAARMLRSMADRSHDVITGVCLLHPLSQARELLADQATVTVGPLTEPMIESYLDTAAWQGKAGAYNLSERIDAGWPIRCVGDPATVMGLPMQRLPEWLHDFERMIERGVSSGQS